MACLCSVMINFSQIWFDFRAPSCDSCGKVKKKVAPFSSLLLLAPIMPPWASIILLDMKRPSPVPLVVDFVANFANSLGNISGSIPVPVSLILTKTSLFFERSYLTSIGFTID
jgi:hypothetical protein